MNFGSSSMDQAEVPQFFLCPISLQIMKDPVTAITGITYERECIEKWLKTAKKAPTCPVTKQKLPKNSYLTPNHTLQRLIQAWCTANATNGVDRIPTPKSDLSQTHVVKLIEDVESPQLCKDALEKIEGLAMENERNRTCLVEAGMAKAMVGLIIKCLKENKKRNLEVGLRILCLIWDSSEEIKILVKENSDFIDSLTWVLQCEIENHIVVKTHAVLVLNKTIDIVSPTILDSLNLGFYKGVLMVIKEKKISQQALKSALHVLTKACQWGQNRCKIVEANAVFELIELELEKPEKNITEHIFNLLASLCCCTDGRAQFLKHAGSIAMLSSRVLRVSAATDDRGVYILGLIAKFSATDEVLREMLRVGAVSKLCMVIQADCTVSLKQKAREILRLHSNLWNNSPCIAVNPLTRYQKKTQ